MSVFAFKVLKTVSTCALDLLEGVAVAKRPKARSAGAMIRVMNMLLNGGSSSEYWEDEESREFEGWLLYSTSNSAAHCAIPDYRM